MLCPNPASIRLVARTVVRANRRRNHERLGRTSERAWSGQRLRAFQRCCCWLSGYEVGHAVLHTTQQTAVRGAHLAQLCSARGTRRCATSCRPRAFICCNSHIRPLRAPASLWQVGRWNDDSNATGFGWAVREMN